jgi:hypothetical protein
MVIHVPLWTLIWLLDCSIHTITKNKRNEHKEARSSRGHILCLVSCDDNNMRREYNEPGLFMANYLGHLMTNLTN